MNTKKEKKISIFTYEDFRKFLEDKFNELKAEKPVYSYRYFSKKAGFASPNFLKLVILGERNLTKESIQKFSNALGLNQKEYEYFENLVFLNQSKTMQEKRFYFENLSKNKKFLLIKKLEKLQYDYYSIWYVPVIREMIELTSFINDDHWIAENIKPTIKPSEVRKAIKILKDLKIKRVMLMTNNPLKQQILESHNIEVVKRIPLVTSDKHLKDYLIAKKKKLGNIIDFHDKQK